MKKLEKIIRIVHTILCFLNLGCLFFALMKLSGGGNVPYRIFRWFNLLFIFVVPMFLMRLAYLQYVLFGIIAVLDVVIYVHKIKNKTVDKKHLLYDILLWIITFGELIFLEEYFLNILWF